MTDVSGDPFADRHYFGELLRKEGFAAGLLRQTPEHRRIPIRILIVEDADGVDDGAGPGGEFHDLRQAARTRIVSTVADDHQHLPVPVAGLQFRQPLGDGVVQSRLASGRRPRDCGFEFGGGSGEPHPVRQTQRHLLVEVDDEHLVFRVAGTHKSPGCGRNLREFLPHRRAVVDDQPRRDRNVFILEKADVLPYAILENFKVLLAQVMDEAAFPIADGRVQDHQGNVHRDSQRVFVVLPGRSLVAGGTRQDEQKKDQESGRPPPAMLPRPQQPPPHRCSPSDCARATKNLLHDAIVRDSERQGPC